MLNFKDRLELALATVFYTLIADTRARVIFSVVDILVALIIIGTMGASAWNFGATNFSQADASVQVMVGTVVPMMAGVAVLLLFIRGRN